MKTPTTSFILCFLIGTTLCILHACRKPQEGSPRQTVRGQIIDEIGRQPLQGVDVKVEGSTKVTTDATGNYSIENVLVSQSTSITATKDGYKPYTDKITISATGSNTANMELAPEGQIYLSPVQPLKVDANDRNKTLTVYNIGNQGTIQIAIKPDPTAQWLSVTPKGAIQIEQGKTAQLTVSVDSKGITTLRDFSAKILFEYSAVNTSYKGTSEYEVIMAVTTLPVVALPAIASVVPLAGGYGTGVTIAGQNFETDTSKVQVLFEGNKKAQITSVSPTELKVNVPVGAKTGTIRVITSQGQATSNAVFTYNLTCTLNTIASLSTPLYLNDITTASDGTLFVAGVEVQNSNQIVRSGVYRISPGSTRETTILERDAGYVYGPLATTARFINPTQLVAVNNDLFIADQYDPTRYRANYTEGYASIRRMTSTDLTNNPPPYYVRLTDRGFIGDMLYLPQGGFNGIAFTDGAYKRYGLDGSVSEFSRYEGLNLFLASDGVDMYALDVEPENNPTRWVLRKRSAATLLDNGTIASGNLGIGSPAAAPDKTNYPKGMAVDAANRCAYIFDRRVVTDGVAYIIYRVGLDDKKVETIYNGFRAVSQFDNGKLLPDASAATFASISCLTFDPVSQRLLLVDVWRGNQIRAMECK